MNATTEYLTKEKGLKEGKDFFVPSKQTVRMAFSPSNETRALAASYSGKLFAAEEDNKEQDGAIAEEHNRKEQDAIDIDSIGEKRVVGRPSYPYLNTAERAMQLRNLALAIHFAFNDDPQTPS